MIEDLKLKTLDAVRRYKKANANRIEAALEAGGFLNQARAEVRHGDWDEYLKSVEVNRRTAEKWMRLARSGVKPTTVANLGGINVTLKRLSEMLDFTAETMHPDKQVPYMKAVLESLPDAKAVHNGSPTTWCCRQCESKYGSPWKLSPEEYQAEWDSTDWLAEFGEVVNKDYATASVEEDIADMVAVHSSVSDEQFEQAVVEAREKGEPITREHLRRKAGLPA